MPGRGTKIPMLYPMAQNEKETTITTTNRTNEVFTDKQKQLKDYGEMSAIIYLIKDLCKEYIKNSYNSIKR